MTTLTTFRRQAAPLAGRYFQATAPASGHSTTTIVFGATGALGSSMTVNDLFTDYWVYLPAASANDRVRVVSTYTPSTGTLTVDRAYSASTVPNSKVVELHGLLQPFADDLSTFTWTTAINEALKHIWLPVEFTITPTAQAVRHSLATQTWITSAQQILDVGWLMSGETRANVDPYRNRAVFGEVEVDGATLYLQHEPRTFATNETIYVRAAKRAYDHCKASGGSYGDQSGLAAEADESPVPAEPVALGALVEALLALRNDLPNAAREELNPKQGEWAARWTSVQRAYLNRLPASRFKRRMSFFSDRRGY